MKKMSKILGALIAMSLSVAAMGCGNNQATNKEVAQTTEEVETQEVSTEEKSGENTSVENANYKIGIIQLVEHSALDAAYEGFVDGLKELGYEDGNNITLDYQNAQGDQSNCQTIASKLVNDQSDLILAIATPAAQAVANTTKDIPILVTAVTDPADSKLVASNETPGGNVTGTSDLTPVKEQINLIPQIVPARVS